MARRYFNIMMDIFLSYRLWRNGTLTDEAFIYRMDKYGEEFEEKEAIEKGAKDDNTKD